MLLFEQRLYEEMKKLIPTTFAAKYHDAMNEAADTWRLPFWDWAMKKPTWNPDNQDDPANKTPGTGPNVPFVITQVNVPVLTSIGDATLVKNPLFNYALKEGSSFGDYGVTDANSVWVRVFAET
jgi:tyrosinase